MNRTTILTICGLLIAVGFLILVKIESRAGRKPSFILVVGGLLLVEMISLSMINVLIGNR